MALALETSLVRLEELHAVSIQYWMLLRLEIDWFVRLSGPIS
jgi:hypothetical protein